MERRSDRVPGPNRCHLSAEPAEEEEEDEEGAALEEARAEAERRKQVQRAQADQTYMKDFDEYKTMYERSIRDPEGFWSEIAIGGAVVDFNFKSTNANQGLCAYKGVPLDMLWYTPMTPPEVLIRMGVKSSPTIMLIAKATAGDAGDAGMLGYEL